MNKEFELMDNILDKKINEKDSYSIRTNGKSKIFNNNPSIKIVPKENNQGLNIYIKENLKFGIVDIPMLITEDNLNDVVYNDFHIGKNSNVTIIAGCGIHNDGCKSTHDGIHRFYLEENSKVKYIEKHYGSGNGDKKFNPTTEMYLGKNSNLNFVSTQIKGVDDTLKNTKAILDDNATLVINEKMLTDKTQKAITNFSVELNGIDSSCRITSRSVATENSYQEFNSNVIGNNKSFAHIECDSIIKDKGNVKSIPEIYAKNVDANLIHEAAIGKIAGDQLIKLMTLGLTNEEAEDRIIKGFLGENYV